MDTKTNVGVSIRSASKHYGTVVALDEVTLDISPGEFVSLLGPSGSGKTTLLGILGGFVLPSSGSVMIGERDVTYMPPHKRDIGVVFQNYALFPHMSVGENVAFPLRARRVPKADRPQKVRAALEMVELAGYEDRAISQLSGGQSQRVALARAMVFEPKLILMDEPLSALDKQLRETMQIELRHLHKRLGATIVYVTHDQREALTMSDRVAILRDGRMIQIGAPEYLHDHPVDSFVANFIGESTLLPVQPAGKDGVKLGEVLLRSEHPVPESGDVMLAIHSEKLLIDDGQSGSEFNRFPCHVEEVVYQGESLKIFAVLQDGTRVSLRQPSNYVARGLIPEPGATMNLALHPKDTILVRRAEGGEASSA